MTAWDAGAIRRGVAVDLLVLVPVLVAYSVLRALGAGGDAAAIVTGVVAAVIAPVAGGVAAGRHRPEGRLSHGAAAAALATVVFVVFRIGDALVRGVAVAPGGLVLLVFVATMFGVLGGTAGGSRG